MTRRIRADLCIVGAGSGGLTVAAGAAQMGAKVVLVEAGEMGGDCLNHGCVPSKALIAAGKHAHAMTTGGPFGVAPVKPEADFAAARDHVARTIAAIAPHDSQERFEGLGVTVIREHAAFVSPREIVAGETRITARRFVIATGSRPASPPIEGLDGVEHFTNETIFGLRARPDHLLVLGGGPIGLEMAQAHRRLGSAVSVIEAAPRVLAREDADLAGIIAGRLRTEGIALHEGRTVARAASGPDGIALSLGDGGTLRGSHLLVATGRSPNVEGLGLEEAGIEATRAGITVDAGLRTTNRRVYAIGDVAGQGQFTHLAGAHGGLVIRSALFGLPTRATGLVVPRVLYTDPELAQVGLTAAEAREQHGDKVEILEAALAENDRARTANLTEGRIRVMVHRGRPIGATIAGAQAGELIGLWTLAIAKRLRISDIAGLILPYPTLSELSKRAAGSFYAPRLFENPRLRRVVRLIQRLP